MIKHQKTGWLGIISLILVVLLLAACNADIPADTVSVAPPSTNGASEEVEIIDDINDLFESSSTSGSSNLETLPADSEIDANGVPIGFTENGNPYRGNPNAPVVLEEFSDFQ
ncbi:MAG: hypothetical protein IAF02_05115 [Anaerolineae bacterium]|nr:hypothetical protein [Anaerolineae bacterium]